MGLSVLRDKEIWQAYREHYYQRLVQSGFGHRNAALLGYVLMLAAGASAVWAAKQDAAIQLGTGVAWSGAYLVMMFIFDRYWGRRCGDRQDAST